MSDLIQHAYARPIGGGPCVECGQPADAHEPLPRFVSITRQEEESLKAGLPAWMAPLWDGIHAWAVNLRPASLKKCTEALAKRVEHIPAQHEAVSFISVVVERAIAAACEKERARLAAEIELLKAEVERLKAENLGLRRDLDTKDEQEFANGEEEGAAAEGARIRRELLEELPVEGAHSGDSYQKGWNAAARMAREQLDRIAQGES